MHLFLIYPLTYASRLYWSMRICPRLQISIFRPIIGGCIPYAGRNVIVLLSSSGTLPLTFVDLTLIVVNFSPRSDLGWVAYGPSMDDADWSRVCMTLGYRSRDTRSMLQVVSTAYPTTTASRRTYSRRVSPHTQSATRRNKGPLCHMSARYDTGPGLCVTCDKSLFDVAKSKRRTFNCGTSSFIRKYCSQPCEHALQTNH